MYAQVRVRTPTATASELEDLMMSPLHVPFPFTFCARNRPPNGAGGAAVTIIAQLSPLIAALDYSFTTLSPLTPILGIAICRPSCYVARAHYTLDRYAHILISRTLNGLPEGRPLCTFMNAPRNVGRR